MEQRWELLKLTYDELKKYLNQNVRRTISIYSLSNQLYVSMGRTQIVPPLAYVLEVMRVMVVASYATQLPYGAWRISTEIPDFVDWDMMNKFAGDEASPIYFLESAIAKSEDKSTTVPVNVPQLKPMPNPKQTRKKDCDDECLSVAFPEIYTREEYENCKFHKPTKKIILPEQVTKVVYGENMEFRFHTLLLEHFGKQHFKTGEVIDLITEKAGPAYCGNHKDRIFRFISGRMILLQERNLIRKVPGSKRLYYINIKWD